MELTCRLAADSHIQVEVKIKGVGLENDEKLDDIECTDDLVSLFGCMEHALHALDRRARSIVPFNTQFAFSKCKVVLRNWDLLFPLSLLEA